MTLGKIDMKWMLCVCGFFLFVKKLQGKLCASEYNWDKIIRRAAR